MEGNRLYKRSVLFVALACIAILAIACGKSEEEKQQDQAIDARYLPTDICVESPEGVMGMRYVNPGMI